MYLLYYTFKIKTKTDTLKSVSAKLII